MKSGQVPISVTKGGSISLQVYRRLADYRSTNSALPHLCLRPGAMRVDLTTPSTPPGAPSSQFDAFQRESVQIFSHAARALTLPRSLGQIYGLLYAAPEPVHLDDVVRSLGISKGSASQGLRWLLDLGAIKRVNLPGDRRDRFVAEIELRRLASGFLRNTAELHLGNGDEHLDRLEAVSEAMPRGKQRDFTRSRSKKLRRWHRFIHRVLPVVLKMAERF